MIAESLAHIWAAEPSTIAGFEPPDLIAPQGARELPTSHLYGYFPAVQLRTLRLHIISVVFASSGTSEPYSEFSQLIAACFRVLFLWNICVASKYFLLKSCLA
jgi:hypothetical protein